MLHGAMFSPCLAALPLLLSNASTCANILLYDAVARVHGSVSSLSCQHAVTACFGAVQARWQEQRDARAAARAMAKQKAKADSSQKAQEVNEFKIAVVHEI